MSPAAPISASPPDDYRRQIGELFAPMSAVAAKNPLAWFPVERSAGELVDATPANRMVAYPYTKYVISVMDVDLAGALIVASHEVADALGVPADRRVYLRGWCYATDPVYVAEHDPTWASPAMAAASSAALRAAGVGIDDVAHLDLYSCFPSSVNLALDALGIRPDDARAPFTVTGGLPYFGGAGSDYLTHSIATMVDVLRNDPGAVGLCSGVGMHLTKHAYAAYSTSPGSGPVAPPDRAGVQAALDARPVKAIRDTATGPATVATYTVLHGRDGSPDWGLAVCALPDGDRCCGEGARRRGEPARTVDRRRVGELWRGSGPWPSHSMTWVWPWHRRAVAVEARGRGEGGASTS